MKQTKEALAQESLFFSLYVLKNIFLIPQNSLKPLQSNR